MRLASTGIYIIVALCNSFPAHADQVATHAAAINDLRQIQVQYLRDATVSGTDLVNYAYTTSRHAGREAACDDVAVDDLPIQAEENTEFIKEKLQPLMSILQRVTRSSVQIPIGGTMRDNFFSGFEEGCETTSTTGRGNVNSGLKALESASLIQREIERRKSEIVQFLTGHER